MKLATDLIPHQADAVAKMLPLRVGALFMEMGTGKSRTAIELAYRRFEAGKIKRVVWFCPVSTKLTIENEIRKHTVDPTVYRFDQKTEENKIPEAFWNIIGVESMSSSGRVILAAASIIDNKTMVILDESSYIKGHKAKRTEWITGISKAARYRMILTGTPISQGIVDLFSQFRFLDERIIGLSSFFSFCSQYVVFDERQPGRIVGTKDMKHLSSRLAPYAYQVTKDECLDLPGKLFSQRVFEMTKSQRDAYNMVKEEFEGEVLAITEEAEDYARQTGKEVEERALAKSISIQIFRMFSRLQQVTCGFLDGKELECNRIAALVEAVRRIPAGEKVIVWTKFRFTIPEIVAALEEFGPVAQFHGGLSEKQRNEQIDSFRGDARFFVATTQCGGHGLTLNEAAYVIFYNNEFKYANRAQAEDRNHRVGQERPVTYVDIVAADSIDVRICDALEKKGNAAATFRDYINKVRDKTKIREALRAL